MVDLGNLQGAGPSPISAMQNAQRTLPFRIPPGILPALLQAQTQQQGLQQQQGLAAQRARAQAVTSANVALQGARADDTRFGILARQVESQERQATLQAEIQSRLAQQQFGLERERLAAKVEQQRGGLDFLFSQLEQRGVLEREAGARGERLAALGQSGALANIRASGTIQKDLANIKDATDRLRITRDEIIRSKISEDQKEAVLAQVDAQLEGLFAQERSLELQSETKIEIAKQQGADQKDITNTQAASALAIKNIDKEIAKSQEALQTQMFEAQQVNSQFKRLVETAQNLSDTGATPEQVRDFIIRNAIGSKLISREEADVLFALPTDGFFSGRAGAGAAGGLAGFGVGAAGGAAIGTAVLPGFGTAIGGVVGGAVFGLLGIISGLILGGSSHKATALAPAPQTQTLGQLPGQTQAPLDLRGITGSFA